MIMQISSSRRKGLAPIEIVIALPFLILMAAYMFRVGIIGLMKSHTAIEARQLAWQARQHRSGSQQPSTPTLPPALQAVRNDNKLTQCWCQGQASRVAQLAPIQVGTTTVNSRVVVLGDTWDHHVTGFRDRGKLSIDPRDARLTSSPLQGLDGLANLSNQFESMASNQINKIIFENNKLSQEIKKLSNIKKMLSDPSKVAKQNLDPKKVEEALDGIKKAFEAIGEMSNLFDRLFNDAPY